VNLSTVISTGKALTSAQVAAANPYAMVPTVSHFSNGMTMMLGSSKTETLGMNMMPEQNKQWFALADLNGSTIGLGFGSSYNLAYSNTLYADQKLAANSANLGVADSLVNLANGGSYFAFGTSIGHGMRVSLSTVNTAKSLPSADALDNVWYTPNASGVSLGVTDKVSDTVTLGMHVGTLNEVHGLLGSNYDTSSAMSFGANNKSTSIGMSAGVDLGRGASMLIEATTVRVTDNSSFSGLIGNLNGVVARSFGMALSQSDLFDRNDNLTFSVKSPLRVVSGTTKMFVTEPDPETGIPVSRFDAVSLTPDGHQVDMKFGYSAMVSKTSNMNFSTGYTMDDNNVRGAKSYNVAFVWNKKF
jgi:hypothetical protein